MTQSGQETLYYWEETQGLGVLPSGPAPTGKQVRYSAQNLRVAPILVDSPEIVAGNEPEEQVNNGFEGGGDIQIPFNPRNYDDWMEGLLWNRWQDDPHGAGSSDPVRVSGAANVTYVQATRTLTTSSTWTATPTEGDKILVQGSGNAYLDGIHTVGAAPTSTEIPLEEDGILSGPRVPNITVPKNMIIIRPQRLTNSLTPTRISFGFERRIQRVLGTFLGTTATPGAPQTDYSQFYAGIPSRLQLQGTGDSPITGAWSWDMAREANSSQSGGASTVLAGTTAFSSSPIFQGIECIKKCSLYVGQMSAVGGDPGRIQDTLRLCPQSLAMEMNNGLIKTPLMCAEPENDYQFGEPLLTFTINGIYENPFARVAFNGQFDAVFELAMVAKNGDGYLFKIPRGKVQLATADTPGRRQTIISQWTVKAFKQTAPVEGDSDRAVEIYRFRQGGYA